MRRVLPIVLTASGLLCGSLTARPATDPYGAIRGDLAQGRADSAIQALQPLIARNANDAEAHNLLCRVYYQEERWDEAIAECEKATAAADNVSAYHWWLGRAYGEKADRVSFLVAYKMSQQVRSEFERAAALDPRNASALSDLGEFYVEAPGIAGGGLGKAETVAAKLGGVDSVRAHQLRSRIAEHRKEFVLAENELKAAIAVDRDPADSWIALASYYRRRQQTDAMLKAIQTGTSLDRGHGAVAVDAASLLIRTNQNFPFAAQLLRKYLASPNKVEDAPAFRVRVTLSKLLAKTGDSDGARREAEAALALARDYQAAAAATNTGR